MTVLSGGTPPRDRPELWRPEVQWASTKDLSGFRLRNTLEWITHDAARMHCGLAPAGSVLVSTRGMSLARRLPIGLVEAPLAFNQDLKCLVPGSEIDGRYLAYLLVARERVILSLVEEAAHGTRRLDTDVLLSLRIAPPNLAAQREIGDFLDRETARVDVLVAAKSRSITLLHEHREALITAAVNREIDLTSKRDVPLAEGVTPGAGA